MVKNKKLEGWKIGGIIGLLIGLIGFTPFLAVLGYILFPLWLPLLAFTEGVLGVELEGPCLNIWCKIPYGFFTLVYFGAIGIIIGLVVDKIRK